MRWLEKPNVGSCLGASVSEVKFAELFRMVWFFRSLVASASGRGRNISCSVPSKSVAGPLRV